MARQHIGSSATKTAVVAAGDRAFGSADNHNAAEYSVVDIRVLELLTARLCHELSGPIAAVNNGVELLTEDTPVAGPSPPISFARDAVALVGDSARRAASRLQFYRFTYGFSQTGRSVGPAPYELARSFFEASRIVCDYAESTRLLSAAWQKLACNLLSVGVDTLPRGGRLAMTARPLSLEAVGESAALSSEAHAALMLTTPIAELTARTVQAYFAGLLARALDCGLIATTEPGRVQLTVIAGPT
jgi:histidine phosphotransferase ChpT